VKTKTIRCNGYGGAWGSLYAEPELVAVFIPDSQSMQGTLEVMVRTKLDALTISTLVGARFVLNERPLDPWIILTIDVGRPEMTEKELRQRIEGFEYPYTEKPEP
jgi:hypothetical protein